MSTSARSIDPMKAALGTFGELHKPTSKETKDERGDPS
jgi:hypothetical protein